jgi:hypothetical protein
MTLTVDVALAKDGDVLSVAEAVKALARQLFRRVVQQL